MLHLTLVRHASTELNEQRRYQGWCDPPLSERGRMQCDALAARLASDRFDRAVTSDLRRCRETMERILPGAPYAPDPQLREIGFGDWDGLTFDECVSRDPLRVQRWIEAPTTITPPGGEPFSRFAERVDRAVDALPLEGSALLVAHGGTLRRIVARALDLSWRHVVLMEMSPCGITRVVLHPEGAHLLFLNDAAHLPPP